MKQKRFYQCAIAVSAVGLLLLFGLIASGKAFPDPWFRIGGPLALLCILAGLVMLGISWLWSLAGAVKRKQYRSALLIGVLGLLVLCQFLYRCFGA